MMPDLWLWATQPYTIIIAQLLVKTRKKSSKKEWIPPRRNVREAAVWCRCVCVWVNLPFLFFYLGESYLFEMKVFFHSTSSFFFPLHICVMMFPRFEMDEEKKEYVVRRMFVSFLPRCRERDRHGRTNRTFTCPLWQMMTLFFCLLLHLQLRW